MNNAEKLHFAENLRRIDRFASTKERFALSQSPSTWVVSRTGLAIFAQGAHWLAQAAATGSVGPRELFSRLHQCDLCDLKSARHYLQEALISYRQLAQERPKVYRPDVAKALTATP